jgi:hypothetical protein
METLMEFLPLVRWIVFFDDGRLYWDGYLIIGSGLVALVVMLLMGGYERDNYSTTVALAVLVSCGAVMAAIVIVSLPGSIAIGLLSYGVLYIPYKIGRIIGDGRWK